MLCKSLISKTPPGKHVHMTRAIQAPPSIEQILQTREIYIYALKYLDPEVGIYPICSMCGKILGPKFHDLTHASKISQIDAAL